jgi:hypothetical protein
MEGVRVIRHFAAFAMLAVVLSQTGCGLVVMAGKMFFGDPMYSSAFHSHTRVDLKKGQKKVLIVVSTPQGIKSDLPSLDFDLVDGIIQRLKRNGIEVVDPNEVTSWMDDNGGVWDDPSELAEEFDADYIAHFDLNQFSYKDAHSPSLLRGNVDGVVYTYEVMKKGDSKRAASVFEGEFHSTYPSRAGVSAAQVSEQVFRKRYVDRISTQLAQMLHDYRASEMLE